jgi:hydroxymethylglutaryl-CoA reductase (NADPH)
MIATVPLPANTSQTGQAPTALPGRGEHGEDARRTRLEWARAESGAALSSLERVGLDPGTLGGNIENLVGTVEIPVGLAGPLRFRGEHADGWITAPLATTEGALVASVARGAKAISRSGGVSTQVLRQRMTRAPYYEFSDVATAARFPRWIDEHMDEIRGQVARVSGHARLISVEPLQLGRGVHLRFAYETGDAAGQNMVTACTWHACRWINEAIAACDQLSLMRFWIEGCATGDKKLCQLSLLETRGSRVTAECHLDRAAVIDVLRVTPEGMLDTYHMGTLGSIQAGTVGLTVNAANLIAAIFAATGQDIACTHESGSAILSLTPEGDGLYAAILLPALVVGTVGGGTGLPNQSDYLRLLDCAGPGRVERLAEIIAGFALALDLSTMAAVTGGQFADAHERLGRNKPVRWFTTADLTPDFFTAAMASLPDRGRVKVTAAARGSAELGSAVLSELAAGVASQKLVGVVPLELTLDDGDGARTLDVVVKAKPVDQELILATNRLASLIGGRVAEEYSRWREWTGFKGTHERELGLYRTAPPRLRAIMPQIYGIHDDPAREAYLVVMEDLTKDVVLKDTADDVRGWTRARVDRALEGLAGGHAEWLGREEELRAQAWLGPVVTADRMSQMRELWAAIATHNAREHSSWIDLALLRRIHRTIAAIPDWWPELEAMPRTLVHNDFNPRNIALRKTDARLVAYDWELATLHIPQRDLAELLAFVLTPDAGDRLVTHHVEMHRRALEAASGEALDPVLWRRGYSLSLWDFVITRLGFYLVSQTQRELGFLGRVTATARRLVDIEIERDRVRAGGSQASPGAARTASVAPTRWRAA